MMKLGDYIFGFVKIDLMEVEMDFRGNLFGIYFFYIVRGDYRLLNISFVLDVFIMKCNVW